jgi:hypothetical protein
MKGHEFPMNSFKEFIQGNSVLSFHRLPSEASKEKTIDHQFYLLLRIGVDYRLLFTEASIIYLRLS